MSTLQSQDAHKVSSRIGLGFEGSGKAQKRLNKEDDRKLLDSRMASNREGSHEVQQLV